MTQPVGLMHGVVTHVGTARVGVAFLSNPDVDGEPVHVELSVLPHRGDEFRVNLRVGEQFSTGERWWTFQRVENLGTYDYVVWLAPVPGETSGINTAALTHGRVSPVDRDGWAVAVRFVSSPARDGLPQRVELALMGPGDEEGHLELRIGDTFPIGSATWRLIAVENAGTWDYVVRIERVRAPGELPEQPAVEFDVGRAERIAHILEFVQLEPRLDDAVVDKVAQAAVHSRMLHEPPARIAEAVAAARHSTVRLTSLVPGGRFGETELRDFLGRLAARLDAARPWPEWRYERVDAAQWNPARVQPLARIDLSPLRLGNLLSVPFERVERDGTTIDLAVLRLAAGPTVALASEVGSRSGGTVLLQHPGDSIQADVAEVLQASGISPDRIRWLGP